MAKSIRPEPPRELMIHAIQAAQREIITLIEADKAKLEEHKRQHREYQNILDEMDTDRPPKNAPTSSAKASISPKSEIKISSEYPKKGTATDKALYVLRNTKEPITSREVIATIFNAEPELNKLSSRDRNLVKSRIYAVISYFAKKNPILKTTKSTSPTDGDKYIFPK